MKNKLIAIFLILTFPFFVIACGVSVDGISIVENSIPESILNTELESKLSEIKLEVSKSDGSKEIISVDKTMISEEDLNKLNLTGSYTIKVTYEGFETEVTISIVTNNYVVKVLYPDNTPVTTGTSVQWCTGNNCFLPVKVNENGIAENKLKDGNYYIHIEGIPSGYTYDPNAYTTTTDNKYVEIKLIKLETITSGDGSADSPYVLTTGAYNVTFAEATKSGMKYFSFTPTEAGKYSIKSMAMDKLAINAIDPYIGFLGTTNNMANIDVSGNKDSLVDINFNHEFEAEANTTYLFVVFVSQATTFPANFDIVIAKA